jgi:alpha-mannosidase
MPFDIYSTKHSCGPRPSECLHFEFRKVFGSFIESQAEDITDENVQKYADLLLKQYRDTASLFPHNVALVFIGGDFTFNNPLEYQQQYDNYNKLISFVNANKNLYKNATIQFGTPSDYFEEVSKRMQGKFPTLVGDFFPYSDIFSSGIPAYWTGSYLLLIYWLCF